MGKKGSSNKWPTGPQMSVTMREASTGKKHTSAKSSLKLQHIKNLAVWATRDATIPPLGAFFGHHLAASSEAFGAPVDPSLFTCQRCESILHPGYNCTIRIEKNKTKARRKGKKTTPPQNNIVYTCHFCSHRNFKRGTPSQPPHPKSTNQNTYPVDISTPDKGKMEVKIRSDPATPLTKPTLTLLDSKRKRSRAKKKVAPESTPIAEKPSNRRRRKSSTSLKESDKRMKLMNLTIPFSMQ